MEGFKEKLTMAESLVRGARRVTAFTGAGISTESGISDFRSTGGIWERYRIVPYQEFISSREARIEYWHMKHELFSEMKDARPNRAHRALADLERMGRLTCLVTQNIDGLHQDAGSQRVIEIHGTNRKALCLGCGNCWPIEEIHARLKEEGFDPRCSGCGGMIKPATVSFGQAMPEQEMAMALDCAVRCDLFIMIGSSLQVEPAASLPREAYRSGASLIYVNRTETPADTLAQVIFRESAGEVLERLVERIVR